MGGMTPAGYAESILRKLPASVQTLPILGGGALRAYFDGTPVKDYDLFFRSHEDFAAVEAAFRNDFGFFPSASNNGALTFYDRDGNEWNLIGFAFGDETEHFNRFDFRCCAMVAWLTPEGTACFASDTYAIQDAETKALYVRNNNGTERTLRRIARYVEVYGYALVGVNETEVEEHDHLESEEYPDTLVPIGTFEAVQRIRRQLRRCPRPAGGGGSDGPC